MGDIIADQVRASHPLPPSKNPLLAFIDRIAGPKAKTPPKLITSVCTGALFLAAAGLLRGYRATTHWNYKSTLALFPGIQIADGYPRYIIDSNRVTGGGISSGLDEAFAITALLLGPQAAKRSQLLIQYAPNPPYKDGDPSVAEPTVLHEVSIEMRDDATTQAFSKYVINWGK